MRRQKVIFVSITVALTLGFALLFYFGFSNSYLRLREAFIDLLGSLKYYFNAIFDRPTDEMPSVVEYSDYVERSRILPADFDSFKAKTVLYFKTLLSRDNLFAWLAIVGKKSVSFSKGLAISLPCILGLWMLIKRLYGRSNNHYNRDTLPLRLYKRTVERFYLFVKNGISGYVHFLRIHSWVPVFWLWIWGFHLNIVTIVIEFFAYYFFFASSFQFGTIYVQLVKLLLDLKTLIKVFPWWILLFIPLFAIKRFRERIALLRLRHCEARNCGFINELPIVSITCGSMGKKKTTMITDMALSQEVMFRQKALDILQKADMAFPNFPWICFENELLKCLEFGTVYNLATVREWIEKKRGRYEKHGDNRLQLYGYKGGKYGLEYDDALSVRHLFDLMETYAKAYFIYVLQSSLIVSNYSIRTDNAIMTEGNFPLWSLDFFSSRKRISRHAHILDFDVLRLGKKLIDANPKAGSFEFGVVAITEIGKERGNNLELKEVKKKGNEANQKNDLFNSWLKMCRHSATVDHFPFIKVFTDEQRPESWGADARDLCDIITILSAEETRLALPFYTIEEMLSEWAFNRFIALYYDFRYRRGDNTLLVYFLKQITAWLWKRNVRIYNKYGYSILRIGQERGTMDGKRSFKRYFLINRKIYSRRFTTDCFSDFFNEMARECKVGLSDYLEYATEKASVDELKQQNSYFINALYGSNESD